MSQYDRGVALAKRENQSELGAEYQRRKQKKIEMAMAIRDGVGPGVLGALVAGGCSAIAYKIVQDNAMALATEKELESLQNQEAMAMALHSTRLQGRALGKMTKTVQSLTESALVSSEKAQAQLAETNHQMMQMQQRPPAAQQSVQHLDPRADWQILGRSHHVQACALERIGIEPAVTPYFEPKAISIRAIDPCAPSTNLRVKIKGVTVGGAPQLMGGCGESTILSDAFVEPIPVNWATISTAALARQLEIEIENPNAIAAEIFVTLWGVAKDSADPPCTSHHGFRYDGRR